MAQPFRRMVSGSLGSQIIMLLKVAGRPGRTARHLCLFSYLPFPPPLEPLPEPLPPLLELPLPEPPPEVPLSRPPPPFPPLPPPEPEALLLETLVGVGLNAFGNV